MLLRGFVARFFVGIGVVTSLVAPAAGGPLVDCCSDGATFCTLPSAGGAAACNALGGMLFQANACAGFDCGVAHQLKAEAAVELEFPLGEPTIIKRLEGPSDVIPGVSIELVEMQLTGGGVTLSESSLDRSLGGLVPPDSFPATSFFDVFWEIEVDGGAIFASTSTPQRIEAIVLDFPALGVPYLSTGPVDLLDDRGQTVGRIVSIEITFSLPPAPPIPGLTKGPAAIAILVLIALGYAVLRLRHRTEGA